MHSRIDNLFEWKREVRPEEETYPGENEDLKKIKDSIKSDPQGIYKEREKEEEEERKKLESMREELKMIFKLNNPQYNKERRKDKQKYKEVENEDSKGKE